jgi:hypothetical protein
MGEIINLRTARKRRERVARERDAEENRARHGRTAAEKIRERKDAEAAARHIDAHRLEREPGKADDPQ